MAAHFSAQGGVQLLHARLDQRVPGLVHHRHPACSFNGRRQALGTLDVKQDLAARHALQHVLGKQHHLPVGVNVGAVLGDNAQAVAVAIKGQSQLGIAVLQGIDQVAQVFGFAGIGVVVGKTAVHFGKQLGHFTAQRPKDGGGGSARNAVAAVHHDFHGARQRDVAGDAVAVGRQHIALTQTAAGRQLPGFVFNGAAQRLDFIAKDGAAVEHHLEAVVVLGVVAAGDLDAGGTQGAGSKVQHRSGARANVDHVQAGFGQPQFQRRHQRRPRQAAIAPHGHGALAFGTRRRTKGAPQRARQCFVHRGGHHAANVIGLENGRMDLHRLAFTKRAETGLAL